MANLCAMNVQEAELEEDAKEYYHQKQGNVKFSQKTTHNEDADEEQQHMGTQQTEDASETNNNNISANAEEGTTEETSTESHMQENIKTIDISFKLFDSLSGLASRSNSVISVPLGPGGRRIFSKFSKNASASESSKKSTTERKQALLSVELVEFRNGFPVDLGVKLDGIPQNETTKFTHNGEEAEAFFCANQTKENIKEQIYRSKGNYSSLSVSKYKNFDANNVEKDIVYLKNNSPVKDDNSESLDGAFAHVPAQHPVISLLNFMKSKRGLESIEETTHISKSGTYEIPAADVKLAAKILRSFLTTELGFCNLSNLSMQVFRLEESAPGTESSSATQLSPWSSKFGVTDNLASEVAADKKMNDKYTLWVTYRIKFVDL